MRGLTVTSHHRPLKPKSSFRRSRIPAIARVELHTEELLASLSEVFSDAAFQRVLSEPDQIQKAAWRSGLNSVSFLIRRASDFVDQKSRYLHEGRKESRHISTVGTIFESDTLVQKCTDAESALPKLGESSSSSEDEVILVKTHNFMPEESVFSAPKGLKPRLKMKLGALTGFKIDRKKNSKPNAEPNSTSSDSITSNEKKPRQLSRRLSYSAQATTLIAAMMRRRSSKKKTVRTRSKSAYLKKSSETSFESTTDSSESNGSRASRKRHTICTGVDSGNHIVSWIPTSESSVSNSSHRKNVRGAKKKIQRRNRRKSSMLTLPFFSLKQKIRPLDDKRCAIRKDLPLDYPMWVLPVAEFMGLTWLMPHQELLEQGKMRPYSASMKAIFFVSHQWSSNTHPDSSTEKLQSFQQILARMLVGHLPGTGLLRTPNDVKVTSGEWQELVPHAHIWMDFMCVPQMVSKNVVTDADVFNTLDQQKKAINSIPAYIIRCSHFFALCPSLRHADTHKKINFRTWLTRGWCRTELYCFMLARGRQGYPIVVTGGNKTPHVIETHYALCNPPGTGNYTCCDLDHRYMTKSGKTHKIDCDKQGICIALANLIKTIESDMLGRGDWSDYVLYHASARYMLQGLELPSVTEMFKIPPNIDAFEAEYLFKEHQMRHWTPLMIAAISGNAGVVFDLVHRPGLDVNARSGTSSPGIIGLGKGSTALHCAVVFCKDPSAKSLATKDDAPEDATVTNITTYLPKQATSTLTQKRSWRRSERVGRSTHLRTQFMMRSRDEADGIEGIICTLLEAGADPNICCDQGNSPIMNTIRFQNEGGFKALVRMATDIDVNQVNPAIGIPALAVAARESTAAFTTFLLEAGADPLHVAADGTTMLMHACMNPEPEVETMKQLNDALKRLRGPILSNTLLKIQRRPRTTRAHMYAILNEQLYRMGLKSRWRTAQTRGMSALHIAAMHGHTSVVKWLLNNGAMDSLYQPNKLGLTPLHMSWEFGPHPNTEAVLSSTILRNQTAKKAQDVASKMVDPIARSGNFDGVFTMDQRTDESNF